MNLILINSEILRVGRAMISLRKSVYSAALTLLTVVAGTGGNAWGLEFWVASNGSDTNSGTQQSPWQTMNKAREYIRDNHLNDNMTEDIIVNFASGEYPMTSPVFFGSDDSGSNGYSVIYRAAGEAGSASLVGASDRDGWSHVSGNIWRIHIGSGRTWGTGTIFENGVRGRLARAPNAVSSARFPQSHGPYKVSVAGGSDPSNNLRNWVQYEPGDFLISSFSSDTARVIWWSIGGTSDWGVAMRSLRSVDSPAEKLYFDANPGYPPSSQDRYFVSGIQSFLDAPGEFFYSKADGWLYYYPLNSGNPDTQDIRVPLNYSPVLIAIEGTLEAPVHHLRFEGFSVGYTNYGGSTWDQGTIDLVSTDHIEIVNCHIHHVGRIGIHMNGDNRNNLIYGCWVEHCGVGGIVVRNTLARSASPNNKSEFHVISNCKIHDLGGALINAQLTAGVALFNVSDCEVSHCEIFNSGRYGTSLRGHWSSQNVSNDDGRNFATRNVFKYIRVTDGMMDSGDGALVHAAHCNPTDGDNINDWKQMIISGGFADSSMQDYPPNGIFLDHPNSCLHQRFTDIKISDTQGAAFRTNNNPSQTFENVSWSGTFDENRLEYSRVGLKADFPEAFDSRQLVIADDHTADYVESISIGDTAIGGLYRGDGRYYGAGSSTRCGRWQPTLPLQGCYEVFAWRMGSDASASAAAPYTITHRGGTASATVDQQTGTAGWKSLGIFPFLSGRPAGGGTVDLFRTSSPVRADAVAFLFVDFAEDGILGGEKGWWGFDDDSNDASGFGHTVTRYSAGYSMVKAVGTKSLYFSGTAHAQAADADDLDIGTGDFAIAGWFYRDALLPNGDPNTASNLRIISKGAGDNSTRGYALWASQYTLTAALCDGSSRRLVQAPHLGAGTWNHFVLNVSRSGYMTLYVNGAKAGMVSISDWRNTDLGNSYDLYFGRNALTPFLHWVGRIDEVMVFQRLLAEIEILALCDVDTL